MRISKNMAACALLGISILSAAAAGTPVAASASSPSSTGGPLPPAAANPRGTLDCRQLEALWEQAGGSQSEAFLAAEVARAESGGDQYATDNNTNGTADRGLWQVNSIWGPLSTYDPLGNAKAAVQISANGTNWSPWVTFQHGAQNGQC